MVSIKQSTSPFVSGVNTPCVDHTLMEVLNINPKVWYDLKYKEILPQTGNYIDFLQALVKYYSSRQEERLANIATKKEIESLKLMEKPERPKKKFDTESGLSLLQEAHLKQKIKLDKVREEQIHIINLRERGKVLEKNELLAVTQPIFVNIANILRNASDSDPAFTPIVDKCFSSLYNVANRIVNECIEDSENYVKEMLNKELDLSEICKSE